jgi:hypothetical protein
MPTTIFDWIARTAMLVMAGLVTLSILGSIAAMTNDPGTGFAATDRPVAEREEVRETAQAPSAAQEGNPEAVAPSGSRGTTIAAPPPAPQDKPARWLEAIAYALLALAGIGALGVLMLWNLVRELRRIGRSPQ